MSLPDESLQNGGSCFLSFCSVGRSVFGVKMQIRDEEGRQVPDGEKGEISVRGLGGMKGYRHNLEAIREARLPSVPWQRCQFHLRQNAVLFVPRIDMRIQVASDLRAIFDSPDRTEAKRHLQIAAKKCKRTPPKPAAWMSS
jgi:hypothetical protein